jgi:hypothetical protein
VKLTALPDPPDERDFSFSQLALSRASKGDITIPCERPARSQVGGSCVANAWLHAIEIRADILRVPCPNLSAQYLYAMSRWISWGGCSAWGAPDIGTNPRAAAAALSKWGVATQEDWPEVEATLNEEPSAFAKASADEWRAAVGGVAYHRVGSLDDIDASLSAGFPVVATYRIGSEWFAYNGIGSIGVPQQIIGGHAIVVVGKHDDNYEIRNSWSPSWGQRGHGLITRELAERFMDAWTGELQWSRA